MFEYAFMRNALAVSALIAILCPCIGIFLVLRRYSMIGDALSHASLAGVAIGLLGGGSPVLGAFLFTSLCGALIEFLRTFFRKFTDLLLTIILALSVGVAVTIISSGKLHANADSYLFGSILTVSGFDMAAILVLCLSAAALVFFLYHQLLYISYDEEAARIAGVRVRLLNYLFAILVACAISVSIRVVGVLVLSSMIALPVAAALQLKRGFRVTLLFSIVFSVTDIMSGLFLSYYLGVAPGGLTALISVGVLLLVMLGRRLARVFAARRLPEPPAGG